MEHGLLVADRQQLPALILPHAIDSIIAAGLNGRNLGRIEFGELLIITRRRQEPADAVGLADLEGGEAHLLAP